MAVGPVTLNGMIPRTQDVSALKQNEDNKPLVEQQNIQVQLKHQEDRQLKQVNHADDANQQKKKKKQDEKNKVIYKQESGRFDMKI